MKPSLTSQKIIFFDGVCNLCNYWVCFLVRQDKKNRFSFAHLQGLTASIMLAKKDSSSLHSLVYYDKGEIRYRSDAVLALLADLGGFWKLILLLKIIPRFIRNLFYNWIARNRYPWFGKKETCRIPLPEERIKFLD